MGPRASSELARVTIRNLRDAFRGAAHELEIELQHVRIQAMRFVFCHIMHHFNPSIHPSDITLLCITMHRGPCYSSMLMAPHAHKSLGSLHVLHWTLALCMEYTGAHASVHWMCPMWGNQNGNILLRMYRRTYTSHRSARRANPMGGPLPWLVASATRQTHSHGRWVRMSPL